MSLIPDGGDNTPPTDTPPAETPSETPPSETPNPESTPPATNPDGTTNSYLLSDDVTADGDAPDWFKGSKYKTISAQAEAYSELESKFGSFTGAPKEGKYEIEGADFENSPLLKLTAEWGAENQLSNEGLESLIGRVNELAAQQVEEDTASAREALGENADKRLGDISQWGKNNLSPDEFTQFQGLAQTAGQVEIIEKLIGMSKNSKLVTPEANPTTSEDRAKELQDMQLATNDKGQRLMEVDATYRAKVNKSMKEFYK